LEKNFYLDGVLHIIATFPESSDYYLLMSTLNVLRLLMTSKEVIQLVKKKITSVEELKYLIQEILKKLKGEKDQIEEEVTVAITLLFCLF
jgi:hypothetical protein